MPPDLTDFTVNNYMLCPVKERLSCTPVTGFEVAAV